MEHSEEIPLSQNTTDHPSTHDTQLGFQHPPPSSSSSNNNSNGDPDPETSDLAHGAVEKEKEKDADETGVNNGVGEMEKKNGYGGGIRKYQYPVRPEAEDCSFYLKTGTWGCKFGKACKYNHTRGKTSAAPLAPVLEFNFVGLPIRVGEKECPYYMRTGSCKYGGNCRFNHPDPTDAAAGSDTSAGYGNGRPVSLQGARQSTLPSWSSPRSLNETAPFMPMMLSPNQGVPSQNSEWNGYQAPVYLPDRNLPPPPAYVMNNPVTETNIYQHHPPQKLMEEYPERPGQPECTFFLKTGDCKFKSNCKYHHPKKIAMGASPCTLSDKGLPLRPDQNICTYYSRYGICKFGPACKYDHPVQQTPTMSSVENQPPLYSNLAGEGARRSRNETTIQQLV
uniref:C3H1-type domain-containing protein n=1 Tax=Cannabis sativa TaxID=3483 RepID=A0A803P8P1_CANSA